MKRRITLAMLIALLQGCATQIAVQSATAPLEADSSRRHALVFQSGAITPADDQAPLGPGSLQAGDILLTAGPGFVSTSIQLLTLSPVSHAALYIGDGKVVEAVRPAVQVRSLDEFLAEGHVALAFRYPDLTPAQAHAIREYALEKTGTGFNFVGLTLHVPFSVKRIVCEMPLVPSPIRDACIRGLGVIHYLSPRESLLFCSQLVLEAYKRAGAPITDADPRLVSPADILHMREGDVPSISIHKPLRHVGYLKYEFTTVATFEQ